MAWVAAAIFLGLLLGFSALSDPGDIVTYIGFTLVFGEVQGPPHTQSTRGLSALFRAAEGPGEFDRKLVRVVLIGLLAAIVALILARY